MEIIKHVEFSKGHFIKLTKENNDYIIVIDYNGPCERINHMTPFKKKFKNISKNKILDIFEYYYNIEDDRHAADESGYASVYRDRSNDKPVDTCGKWIKRIEK
jgi:hypothetical protein